MHNRTSNLDRAQPLVLRSRHQLMQRGVNFVPPGAVAPARLPIQADGTTYSMAQEAAWLDAAHFAVGRWDGSLSIFRFNPSRTTGPVITQAVSSPAAEGIQMIVWLAPGVFATVPIQSDQRLDVIGYQEVSSALGAALAFNVSGQLVMVNHNLYEFVTRSTPTEPVSDNPERIPSAITP